MPRNPFLSRRPVEDPRQFFGRRQEARRIVDLLGAELPQSFFVVGERRIGKTSLLKFVSHPQGGPTEFAELLSRPPDHYLFVYIDLEILEPDGGALDARIVFFRLLFSRLNQVVQERLSQPPEIPERLGRLFERYYPATRLDELVREGIDEYLQAVDRTGRVLVLLLDEADAIVRLGIGHMLRPLIGSRALAYGIATQRPLQELDPERELSPLFNICTPIRLGLLEAEDAQALVTRSAAAEGYDFSPEDLEFILKTGGRHPDFIKVAARHVLDERLLSETPCPLDLLHRQICLDLEASCHSLWRSFEDEEKHLALRIARRQPVPPQATLVVDRLAEYGVVDPDPLGPTRLFSRVFEEYVQKQSQRPIPGEVRKRETALQPPSPALELIFGENYVSFKGAKISVSQKELRLLKCLYANAGQVCSRQQIYQQVWGHNAYSDAKTATVNIAVQRLREKLKAHWGEDLSIDAERGKGYRLIL